MAFDLFKLAGSVFIDTEEANKSLSKTDDKAQKFGKVLGGIGKTALGVGTAVVGFGVATTTALVDVSVKSSETADNIDKMSQKLGISAEAYQEWGYVLERNGANIDGLQTGLKTLANTMDDASNGSSSAQEKFDRLGVSFTNIDGTMKSTEQMFNDIVMALSSMPESAERTALATDLLGKSATELQPMFNSGSQAIEELKQNAHDLGLVMSDEAVKSGAEMQDMLTDLESSFGALKTQMGAALMPILTELISFVVDNMPFIQDLIARLQPVAQGFFDMLIPIIEQLITELLPVFEDLITTIQPLLADLIEAVLPIIVELMQKLIPFAMTIIKELLPVAVELLIAFLPLVDALLPLLDPILECIIELTEALLPIITDTLPILINLLTVVLGDVLVPLVNYMMGNLAHTLNFIIKLIVDNVVPSVNQLFNAFKGLLDFVVGIFTGDFERAISGLKSFVEGIFKSIANSLIGTANGIVDTINFVIKQASDVFNKIPKEIPLIGGIKFNAPQIPRLPMLAEGGTLLEGGSVIVGEKAPEILDLPTGARVRPLDNLGTLSKADMTEAFKEALLSVGISLELSTNSDAIFDNVVRSNTEYRRRHNGASALA